MLDSEDLILNLTDKKISEVIDSVFRIFRNKAKEKQLEMINEVDDQLIKKVDVTFFRQVIANIISNAIKFSNQNGSIKCFLIQKGNKPQLVVSDNGIGIPEEADRQNMFNAEFSKSRRGTKGEKGTGIGLTICKKILDAHGFEISYKPGEEKGSNFIITL